MFDAMEGLRTGFSVADVQLAKAQHDVAGAEAGDRRGADAAMARLARSTLFTEALLASTRARLQEIASAAKA